MLISNDDSSKIDLNASVILNKNITYNEDINYSTKTTLSLPSPPPIKLVNKSNPKKRKVSDKLPIIQDTIEWKCPNITRTRNLECGCDLPHTLRCSGDIHGLEVKNDVTFK